MMSVIEKLKVESINLRKTRNPVAASIVFALSEIEKFGKNNGNRATTEDEAIKVIQKLIATIDENLKLNIDDGRKIALNFERNILAGVLPQMASDQEIATFLSVFMTSRNKMGPVPKKGEIMKALRDQFGALVDMKRAGEIVTDVYGI
jgi:uncharacterized protein YqeY